MSTSIEAAYVGTEPGENPFDTGADAGFSLEDFASANAEDEASVRSVTRLDVGETVALGGGACPDVFVTRLR